MIALLLTGLLAASSAVFDGPPLPNRDQLKARAIESMKKSEKALENYSCIVHEQTDELNAGGTVKHHHSRVEEQFYVNGVEIDHVLSRDGKPLTGSDAKKEQERVDKETKKYSSEKQAQKVEAEVEKEINLFLEALHFQNGHRQTWNGRSIIVYDLSGDPHFRPKNIEGRFAQALSGKIWLDEETGTPVQMQVHTDRDVKIGGGLLANLHRGFRLQLEQQRQPDGVWILKSLEGTGDARAALFLHPRFRFREELDGCHLFSVNAKETLRHP